jgi:hypothetical protein
MMTSRRIVHRSLLAGLALAGLGAVTAGACSDDLNGTGTTLSTTTSESPPTTEAPPDPASNVESLSYLMQGLLTTPQIGGGWIDMGRVVVPPSTDRQIGPLCAEGEALAAPIGAALNAQVHTTFSRFSDETAATGTDGAANPNLTGGMVMETLLWNERAMVDAAFAALVAATNACIGSEWTDPDMGNTLMTSFDAPALGASSFTFGYAPVDPPETDPWAEVAGITALMSDEASPVSLVIAVSMTVVHEPGVDVEGPDTGELIRIAEAAAARIEAGL